MIKRILIIDDDRVIRKLYMHALEDTSYQVDTVESGKKGIELFSEFNYDLVLLDLNMPDMNGIEVLRKIRATDPDIPVYIITAFYKDFLDEISSAIEDGLKFEITHKPILPDQIVLIAKGTLENTNAY
jgi:DNA-binding response OmpR family regulator